MNIFNTHTYKLRFYIDNDAPRYYINRWNKFKKICESGNNIKIAEQIKDNCKLIINKCLPILNVVEGGLGNNNKQIRFRYNWSILSNKYETFDNYIILDQIYNTDIQKWTYKELDDLIYGFIKTANNYVKENCINGCIEMHTNILFDEYDTD